MIKQPQKKTLGGELKSNLPVVKYNSKISNTYHQIKFRKIITNWSSIKKLFPKILQYSSKKHLYWSLFLNKNSGLQSWNFIKKRLQHRCFPVNIVKFSRTRVLKNICKRLFELFPTWANNITSNIGSEESIFPKTKQKKVLRLRGIFRTMSDIYDGAFLRK